MKLAGLVVGSACFLACRQIAGIEPITYVDASGDGVSGEGGCTAGTPLFGSTQSYNVIAAQDLFAYSDITNAGVWRCPAAGCSAPTSVVNVPNSTINTYQSFALSASLIYYTYQGSPGDGGTDGALHSVGLDGTNDQQVLANLDYPYWVATSGSRVFWVDDPLSFAGTTPATVNCVGCNGSGSTPWITGLTQTYALIADANWVYVLVDDGTGTLTDNLVACSTQTACGANPKKLATSIANLTAPESTYITSDGTYAYIARPSHTDVIRVDTAGNATEIVKAQNVFAIVADTLGNLYFANDSGFIFSTKSDGTGTPTEIVCNPSLPTAIAVDAQNIYFLAGSPNTSPYAAPL